LVSRRPLIDHVRPCSARVSRFIPLPTDLKVSLSSPLMGRVSFLFWSQPSPTAPLGAARPALREELPQEVPVARPPARVWRGSGGSRINRFLFYEEVREELPLPLEDLPLGPASPVLFQRVVVEGQERGAPLVDVQVAPSLLDLSEDVEGPGERL